MSGFKRKTRTGLLGNLLRALNAAAMTVDSPVLLDVLRRRRSRSRRQFLQQAAGAAAVLASLESGEVMAKRNAPRVVIVGAGLSGLYAAYILQRQGIRASVYEASQRTGGRVFSVRNVMGQGLTTEFGGEFIDSGHADMLHLARHFELPLLDMQAKSEQTLNAQVYFFAGLHFSEAQVVAAFTPFAARILEDVAALSEVIDVDQHSEADVYFDGLSLADYFDRIGLEGWLRNLLEVAYVTEFGRGLEQQTCLNFLLLLDPHVVDGRFRIFGDSDERFKVAGGNQRICDRLTQALHGQIQLGHELRVLQQRGQGYVLQFTQAGERSRSVKADIVLLTIPFTRLRKVQMRPGWPVWKQQVIQSLGYGNNSKLILGFDRRVWREQGYAGYYFSDTRLQSGWDSSQLQGGAAGSMTIYAGGEDALRLADGSAAMRAGAHLALLEEMYSGISGHFNGKAERFVWPAHEYTLASYACYAPGQYTQFAGLEMRPVGKIFFAGEHCSYEFQGFMNGAAETGRRAAEAILESVGVSIPHNSGKGV